MLTPRMERNRPLSPHLQIYSPQLTSVLSFAHRLSGLTLGLYSIALVAWLIAAAAGSEPYSVALGFVGSSVGQIVLVAGTWCFFLHLCGGIRHLFWDAGRGLELRSIYLSGWAVMITSTVLTAMAWIVSFTLVR